MPSHFRLAVDRFTEVPLLRLSGDMVFGQNLGELHRAAASLAAEKHTRLVLDLNDVGAADSAGLGALLDVKHILGETGSTVFLLRPSARVLQSLSLIRVTPMFEVVLDDADLHRRLETP